jgi:hypothetical protein
VAAASATLATCKRGGSDSEQASKNATDNDPFFNAHLFNYRLSSFSLRIASFSCKAESRLAFVFSRLFELARVLVRFNHVASFIVNANHGTM